MADRRSTYSIEEADIDHRFGYHKATEATLPQHREMRVAFRTMGRVLLSLPEGRDKALALTALEEASMWSHKAIAMTAPLVEE